MITPKIGQAMAAATTRHNDTRTQKLVLFYKALEVIKASSEEWVKKVVFVGTLGGKQAEVFLLNTDDVITLNLTIEGVTFKPLKITEVINENDYLSWNLTVRKEMANPPQEQTQPTPTPRSNKIVNPKKVSQKAKTHDVTPVDHNTFQINSSSGNTYLVRLLDKEGGMCNCKWGQYRKASDNYQSACSHVQAVYSQLEGQRNRTTSAWSTKKDALRQHRQMTKIGDGVILTSRRTCKSPASIM